MLNDEAHRLTRNDHTKLVRNERCSLVYSYYYCYLEKLFNESFAPIVNKQIYLKGLGTDEFIGLSYCRQCNGRLGLLEIPEAIQMSVHRAKQNVSKKYSYLRNSSSFLVLQ